MVGRVGFEPTTKRFKNQLYVIAVFFSNTATYLLFPAFSVYILLNIYRYVSNTYGRRKAGIVGNSVYN